MNATDDRLATLASFAGEFEAQLLVNLLDDQGIAARTTGTFTCQMRAEAPGSVRVLVKSADLAAARSVVQQARIETQPSVEDREASEHPAGFRRFVRWIIWAMLIVELVALAGFSLVGQAGGNLLFNGLALSLGITAAILWRFRRT